MPDLPIIGASPELLCHRTGRSPVGVTVVPGEECQCAACVATRRIEQLRKRVSELESGGAAYRHGYSDGAAAVVALQRHHCDQADELGERGPLFDLVRRGMRSMVYLAECVRDEIEPASPLDEWLAHLRGERN